MTFECKQSPFSAIDIETLFEEPGNERVSRRSQLKADIAKLYLEQHFAGIIDEAAERKKRHGEFLQRIDDTSITEEERDSLIQQFIKEESELRRLTRSRLKIGLYEKIKMIGKGGFGEVWLAMDKATSQLYALKILRKSDIIKGDQLLNVRNERDLLCSVHNPWIVKMHRSFQDEHRLYLVLEYVPGGDLMTALIRLDKFNELTARFFAGEIALALNSIHQMNYVHCDLKPDNILLGTDGHIKLTDFGLSTRFAVHEEHFKELMGGLQDELLGREPPSCFHHQRASCIGTYDYSAPEVLRGQPPNAASDYWSLGIILYEMLYGYNPFYGRSPQEIALRIIHFEHSLRFPNDPNVSKLAIDLIKHLLCKPEERYGLTQMINHPFFDGFDFSEPQINQPPLVPSITYPTDTSHFDDFDVYEEPSEELPGDSSMTRFAFQGFTYKEKPCRESVMRLSAFVV